MATITQPAATRALAVQGAQPLSLQSDVATNWWKRNQTTSEAWTQINGGGTVSALVWTTPSSVTNRLTFDRIQVKASDLQPTDDTGALNLNLCEGPVAVLWATDRIANEAMEEPPLRPWEGEDDDPPLGVPLAMPGANRDRMGTVVCETASEAGGPANLVALHGPGLFVDTTGKLGARTPFMSDVRGAGPFPAIASYHHGGLYFQHDFGKSRTLGLTRVLYEDADGHVAVVRGDGRRNSYRSIGSGSYTAAAGLQNTLVRQLAPPSFEVFEFVETTPSGRAYRYDSSGRLQSVIDRAGNTAYYTYDANSRLQKIQGASSNALGLVPYLSYDGSGLLERLVLELAEDPTKNRTAYFQYDGDRNLTRIIGPESCMTYFAYAADPRFLASVTDPEGYTWSAGYDGSDRADRVVDALGAAAYFAYDTAVPLVTQKDRAGKATYFRFDAFGAPDRVFNVGTPADYYTYDGEGNLTSARNRLGESWTFEYDGRSNRIAATDPRGARSYFAYDGQDLLRTYVDALGRSTYLDYDGTRNRTKTIDALGNTTYYAYEATGLLEERKDRRGATTRFGYDLRANVDRVVDPLGNVSYFAHNMAGERTTQRDPLGRVSYLEHDLRGRVVKSLDPLGAPTYLAYDARCNLVSQKDARLNQTTHAYDGNSNRTRTIDALGNPTYFGYDAEERLSSRKDARLNETTWTYDALGRRQKETDALGGVTYLGYDAAHELTLQVDARGNPTYFGYDVAGRPVQQTDAELDSRLTVYDLRGNRTRSVVPSDTAPAARLFWTDSVLDTIKSCDADGGDVQTLVSTDLSVPRGVVVDPMRGHLYWLDSGNDTIKRSALDGTGVRTIVSSGLSTPRFLAIDVVAGKLYWTDSGNDTIKRCDLDGSDVETLVSTGLSTPEGIVVDPAGGHMYWTDSGGTPSIKRANLDGSSVTTLVSTGLSSPGEIALDVAGGKMYWVDSGNDTIKRANMADGSSVETLVDSGDGLSAPRGLALDLVGGKIYWVDAGSDKVQRANLDGSSVEDLVTTGLSSPESIALLAARVTVFSHDALDRVTSVEDAVGAARTTTYDEEGNRLRSIDPRGYTTYFTYDVAGRLTHAEDANAGVTYTGYDAASQVVLRTDELGQPTYLTYDAAGRQKYVTNALLQTTYHGYDLTGNPVKTLLPSEAEAIYWTDSGSDTIKRCRADGSEVTTLVSTDLMVPRGIVVDARNGHLYWIDSGNDTLKRANLEGSSVTTLVSTGLSTPRGLAIDVDAGHLYWIDSGNDTLKRSALDGTGVTTILNATAAGFSTPEGIALDLSARKVYWTDSGNATIKRANLDGTSVETLVSTGLTSPAEIDLDVVGGHMYWIDSGNDTIKRADLDGSNVTTLMSSGLTTPRGLRLDLAARVMYFIDSGTDKLQRANLDGTNVTDLVTSGLTTPEDLALELPVRVTTHAYDAVNRRTSTTDAYGSVASSEYDGVGNVTRSIDPRGFATYFTYDALNRRTHTKDGVHFAATYMGYDAVGNVVRQVDVQGVTTYMTYDLLNRASFVHDPAEALTYHTFDDVGRRTETHVLLGAGGERRSTYLQYDLVDRAVRRIAPDGGETYMEYDLAGNQVRTVDPEGRPTYLTYDALSRQETRKNALGHTWTTVYDARSSVTRQIDPAGRTAYMSYDALRRVSNQSNALGEYSYFSYDARGLRTRVQNPRGYSTYFRHDLLGRQTHRTDALGGVSYMGYDQVGNQVLALDELGNPTYFTHDGLNRSTHVKDALGGVTYMGYDSRSSAVLRLDADGRATYMAHDPARRLERQWFANPVAGESADSPIYYTYDQVGNLLTSDDSLAGLGVSVFEYDEVDRVTKKATLAGPVYYGYDLSGMKTEVKDPNLEAVGSAYDAAGRLIRTTVVASPNRESYYHYDDAGLIEKKVLSGNRVLSYYSYDVAGRLSQLVNLDSTASLLTYFAYQRNPNGAVTRINHEGNEWTYFTYDALDRLTEERRTQNPTIYGYEYQYDAASNRTRKKDLVSAAVTSYSPNALNLIESETTGAVETVYEYDQSQRMKTRYSADEATYFSHNQRDLPTKLEFALSSGTPDNTREFKYTGTGERAAIVGELGSGYQTYLTYDGSKVLTERDEFFTYGKYRWGAPQHGGGLVESEDQESGTFEGPVMDERGSVDKLVGTSGRVVYDRFGVELANNLASSTRTRFVAPAFLRLGTSGLRVSLTSGGIYLTEQGCLALGPDALVRQILGIGLSEVASLGIVVPSLLGAIPPPVGGGMEGQNREDFDPLGGPPPPPPPPQEPEEDVDPDTEDMDKIGGGVLWIDRNTPWIGNAYGCHPKKRSRISIEGVGMATEVCVIPNAAYFGIDAQAQTQSDCRDRAIVAATDKAREDAIRRWSLAFPKTVTCPEECPHPRTLHREEFLRLDRDLELQTPNPCLWAKGGRGQPWWICLRFVTTYLIRISARHRYTFVCDKYRRVS